jgi:predicted HTH transcriptional regulator
MDFIYGLVTGIGVSAITCLVYFRFIKRPDEIKEKIIYQSEDAAKKSANMAKIEEFISSTDRFTNDDLEKLLGVSNATIGRYLEEFESAGKIRQVGTEGKFVYYTKS